MSLKKQALSYRKKQKGFTLIELIITVAIVGVLSQVAIPAYVTYVTKAKLMNAFSLLTNYKTAVDEYLAMNGDFSQLNPGWKNGGFVKDTFGIEGINVQARDDLNIYLRGWVSNKNRYYAYAYVYNHWTPLHPKAPTIISLWTTKLPNGNGFKHECHYYRHGVGWDKVGGEFLPISCRR